MVRYELLKFLLHYLDKWSIFRNQPHTDNTYGLLEVVNATYIKWTYIYSNKTVIDQLDLFKVA